MALEPYSQVCLVCVNSGVSTGWQIVYKKICWEVEVEAFLLGAKGSDINFPATKVFSKCSFVRYLVVMMVPDEFI